MLLTEAVAQTGCQSMFSVDRISRQGDRFLGRIRMDADTLHSLRLENIGLLFEKFSGLETMLGRIIPMANKKNLGRIAIVYSSKGAGAYFYDTLCGRGLCQPTKKPPITWQVGCLVFTSVEGLFSNWNNFQRIMSLFGLTKGRLISRFPRNWQRLVYDSCVSGTTERSRVEIALNRISKEVLLPRKHEWDKNSNWIDNAIDEHSRHPFHAVLASKSKTSKPFLVDASDLDHTLLPALLKAGPSKIILRTAEELGRTVRPLFLLSNRILIVEPNFTINSPKFLDPWASLMKSVMDCGGNLRANLTIELHMDADKLNQFVAPQDSLDAKLGPFIPAGNSVTVVSWPKEYVHNRYLLTDMAGLMLGEGLGLPDSLASRIDDTLCFIDCATTAKLHKKYSQMEASQAKYIVVGTMHI